jgi:hypothetical protein
MMRTAHRSRRRRRDPVNAALIAVALLLVVQMWLLTATLESSLAGHDEVALPAFIASAVLLLAGVAVYVFVRRLDRLPAADERVGGEGPWMIDQGAPPARGGR